MYKDPCPVPGSSMWDLWWREWTEAHFPLSTKVIACQLIILPIFHTCLSSSSVAVGPLEATVARDHISPYFYTNTHIDVYACTHMHTLVLYKYYCHVFGGCMTEYNRFWIGWSNLLALLLQLQSLWQLTLNDCQRFTPFFTRLWVSSLLLWRITPHTLNSLMNELQLFHNF
jgi:hypothetical protein